MRPKAMGASKISVIRLVAVCLGLFVGLAAVEMATRVLSLAPSVEGQYGDHVSDADLPFKRKPLSHNIGRNATNEFDYDYRHNSFGLRDVEHLLAKGEETFRILGLGDSFTYGVGVSFEDTYLYRLEETLNNRAGTHPRVEVIKAGMPRYFPELERILFEKYGAQFQPDLIMVGFLPNDVIDTYIGLDAVKVDPSGYLKTREAEELGQLGIQVYQYCHFCRILIRTYLSWRIERKYRLREDELYQAGGFYESDWVKVELEYDKLVALAGSIGARLVILHIPQKGPWTDKHRYPAARLSAWAARRNIDFIDLLPAMERAWTRQRLYYEKDGHSTPAGHAIFAEEIYRYLIDSNLIP